LDVVHFSATGRPWAQRDRATVAIRDLNEARRYIAHPALGTRLRQVVKLLLRHNGKSALEILGSPDDLKFRSSLTLFREAARDDADRALFVKALDRFYRGDPDEHTLELLGPKR
jgi:uncharacterized protein (DUF1810 family)